MRASLLKGIIAFFMVTHSIWGYVHQRTGAGDRSAWPDNTTINLRVNGANSSGISESNILAITSQVAGRWNEADAPNISISSSSGAQVGRSDLYFSNSTTFFSSSSVLAVTQTVFNESNGKIIESDIIIKDSVLFTSTPGNDPYIGDLIAHEMGHLLGLDHASLPFSSMFYRLVRGQGTPEFDDLHGLSRLYQPSPSSGGTIRGKVAGSQAQVPVFGAEVNLVSSLEGRIIASVLAEQDGSFEFAGLPLGDVYYLYVKPSDILNTVSPFYQTAREDFCTGFASFKGSFFETCNNGRRGYPQGIPLKEGQALIDIGLLSIKCDLKTRLDYFTGRAQGNLSLGARDREGDSMSGFFTSADIAAGERDVFTLDLSHIDASAGNLYLDLSLLSQDFQSRVAFELEVQNNVFLAQYNETVNSDFNPNLNLKGRIPLDSLNSANNVFTIRVTPTAFEDYLLTSSFGSSSFYFPDFATIGDDRSFYQLIFFVGKQNGSNYTLFDHYDYRDFRGNERCMEAEKTYGVRSAAAIAGSTTRRGSSSSSGEAIAACGTIALIDQDRGDPPSGGGMMISLLLGLGIALILSSLSSVQNVSRE